MPIRAAFFESTAGDRRYTADRWAQVFAAIVTQGYIPGFANNLAVVESIPPAMSVMISTGAGFIQGRYVEVYTTPISLVVTAAHQTQYRRDLVILRLDLSAGIRDIVATVKAGALAATAGAAVYPALQRDATIYEVALAGILVAPADTAIQNAEITDLREVGVNFGRSSFPDLTSHKTAAVLDHPDNSVTDAKIGGRTAVSTYPTAQLNGPFTLTTWLGYIINMFSQIVGGASWWSVPISNMAALHTRASTLEGQLGGRTANDQANQIPIYDGNRRVVDSNALQGRTVGVFVNGIANYDNNNRVYDTNYFAGQPASYYGTAAGVAANAAAITAINSVRPNTIVAFPSAAYIPAGYVRLSAADGRVLIGGGTTFGVGFTEGTQPGGSWAHAHAAAGLATSASNTGNISSGFAREGTGSAIVAPDHSHSIPALAVTGSVSSSTFIPPAFVVAFAQKQ